MNTYYKILNEIASAFDMDQWDEQVNLFTAVIDRRLNAFVHNTKYDYIYISDDTFPQFDFYRKRCYINGEKVKLTKEGLTKNKWKDRKTVDVMIEDLDQLGESCKYMFYWCNSLVSVPLFDTSRVTDMESMFAWCRSLVSVPEFDTSRVTNMEGIFYGCDSLSEKTIEEWSSVYNFDTEKMK